MKHATFFFLIVLWNLADSIIYLEEVCEYDSNPTLTWSTFGELKATRTNSYSVGKNCSFIFSSPYEVIISIKKISFRPGCYDYLKISDETKNVALCGNKNEHDTNMQFYGRNVYLNYLTENDGPDPDGLTGFHLIYTLSERNVSCDGASRLRCKNGYCISKRFVCDNNNNCGDFSDEKSCDVARGVLLVIAMPIVCLMGVIAGFCISIGLKVVIKYSYSRFRRMGNIELRITIHRFVVRNSNHSATGLAIERCLGCLPTGCLTAEDDQGLQQVFLVFLASYIFRRSRTLPTEMDSTNQTAPDLPERSESERF